MKISRMINFIVLLVFVFGIIFINVNYIQPYSMFGEGGDYCKALSQEGYFEGPYDTADHRNCTIGYEEGINKEKKHWSCPFRENCFSYDDYDDDCELKLDMKDFGIRCVWGGLGFFATALTILFWMTPIYIIIIIFFGKGEEEKKDETKSDSTSVQ